MSNLKFSLILATLGRDQQVSEFLESIFRQDYPLNLIEVIVVDQNEDDRLISIIEKYNEFFSIHHIRSNVKGLSINRNIGIKSSCGDIFCFPDDDCIYPQSALSNVIKYMSNTDIDFIMGRIFDPIKNKHSFRKWPLKNKSINRFNFYRLTSSITMFFRRRVDSDAIYFDEEFGVGAKYFSNEDAIYIYTNLINGKRGEYKFDIIIYHDDQPINILPSDKVAMYSYGFGCFIRKYISAPLLILFIMSVSFQIFGAIVSIFRKDTNASKLRLISLLSRLRGLYGK